MAHYAVYKSNSGEILKTIEAPEWLINEIVLDDGESIIPINRQASDATEIIRDGSLVDKPSSEDDQTSVEYEPPIA